MTTAALISYSSMGFFMLFGMLFGVWKYVCIDRTAKAEARAPVYVDIAHRASLMYSFACLVLARLVELSGLAHWVETLAVSSAIGYFWLAVASYVLHGLLKDTDNQLAVPHRVGSRTMPRWAMRGFMVTLIVAEIGGVAVLLFGFLFHPAP